MKPKLSEYLVILFSLAAIFACGCGIGFLYCENHSAGNTGTIPSLTPDSAIQLSWEQRTLENLNKSLDLSKDQQDSIAREIEKTSSEISETKKQALDDYYAHLLTLHERILPQLSPSQKERMTEDTDKLKKLIDSR